MKRLPASFRELLLVVLGAYGMVAGFALLCNWNGQERVAVIVVLLIALVGLLMIEGLAVATILALASRGNPKPVLTKPRKDQHK